MSFGVQNLPSYGYYVNERTAFRAWSIAGNTLVQFDDGIRIARLKDGITLDLAEIRGNLFTTMHDKPRGIWLAGPSTSPDSGFIDDLAVDANVFACGFPAIAHAARPDAAEERVRQAERSVFHGKHRVDRRLSAADRQAAVNEPLAAFAFFPSI